MKILCTAILATGLAVMSVGTALATPPIGSGGGYFGGAWFDSGQGITSGPHSNYHSCTVALQNSIDYRVTNWGWAVVTLEPCSHTPPYGYAVAHYELQVWAEDLGQFADIATGLLYEAASLPET